MCTHIYIYIYIYTYIHTYIHIYAHVEVPAGLPPRGSASVFGSPTPTASWFEAAEHCSVFVLSRLAFGRSSVRSVVCELTPETCQCVLLGV